MAIPTYQQIMLPLLQLLSDGEERRINDVAGAIASHFGLSDEERKKLLPSGRSPVIKNRTHWARTYLKQAGLLETTRRGVFRITQRGRDVLAQKPEPFDKKYLERFPEFVDFRQRGRRQTDSPSQPEPTTDETPEESLETAYERLRTSLEAEVLAQVRASTPEFFEKLVVELLVKMGYGGTLEDAGQAVGRSGDGGIDGIIKEDRLGLDVIYVQAKRWENTVGRPEIQKFAGALQGHRARKGVFLTTAGFSREATEYAANLETKIVLVDGEELASLMIDHDLGVSVVGTYAVKKLDGDYFEDDGSL